MYITKFYLSHILKWEGRNEIKIQNDQVIKKPIKTKLLWFSYILYNLKLIYLIIQIFIILIFPNDEILIKFINLILNKLY
jgi:hypothetical protein